MEHIFEEELTIKHLTPLVLPFKFTYTGSAPTYERLEISPAELALDEIPADTDVYFNVVTRDSSWWGTGVEDAKQVYRVLVENPLLLSINTKLYYTDFVTAKANGVNPKNKASVSQEVILGISYRNTHGTFSVIVLSFTIDTNEFEEGTVKVRTDIINNVDHQHLPTSTMRNFNERGFTSDCELNFVTDSTYNNTPLTDKLTEITVPVFELENEGVDNAIRYQEGMLVSTSVLLYDPSVTISEVLSQEI